MHVVASSIPAETGRNHAKGRVNRNIKYKVRTCLSKYETL